MAVKLKAAKRESLSKSAIKQIRKSGQVPSVVYGKGKESSPIAVDSMELIKALRNEGRNAIISLDLDGAESVDVMLHEYQMDPIKDELVHADFYIVDMSEEMNVPVPIRIEGEAIGAKEGGVLQQPLFELQVRAKPGDIPDEIAIDVSSLAIGDTITIEDLPSAEKFEYLDEKDTTVVTIVPPDTEDNSEGQADENGEPELVGAQKQANEE